MRNRSVQRRTHTGRGALVRGGRSGTSPRLAGYSGLLVDVARLVADSRRAAARSVNAVMTTTYWLVGRRIVEEEQRGAPRAGYGEQLIERLSCDLSRRFGRGFSRRNLEQMRGFYLGWPIPQTASAELRGSGVRAEIPQTASAELRGSGMRAEIPQTASAELAPASRAAPPRFLLSWSHYVRLLSVKSAHARAFYEAEALRGGWTNRQLDRQIQTRFYERTALSRDKAAMLRSGAEAQAEDEVSPEAEIKDPYILEFLDLKDEYSESDLEAALIACLESFLLELGDDFAFIGRQRRLRLDDEWYKVDLVFFHRRLRCLIIVDLKLGRLTHADAGQMHMYLGYAREHWVRPGERPPIGLILCAEKGESVARYSLGGLPNKVFAAEYRTALPNEDRIAAELSLARAQIERRVSPATRGTARSPRRRARSRRGRA